MFLLNIILIITVAFAKRQKVCPPCVSPCQVCDTKKFVCVAANEFSSCNLGNTIGVCYFGQCNTQIQAPTTPAPVCKIYRCTPGAPCNLVNQADGTDCTPQGALVHSICMAGTCSPILEGLNEVGQNIGCWLAKDNTPCDTNEIFTDNEICLNNVCRLPPPRRPLKPAVAIPRKACGAMTIGAECLGMSTVVTDANMPFHFFCLQSGAQKTCQPVIEGLTFTAPVYNIGCKFMKDNTHCDTNENLQDGEKCINGVCVFPDGSYNGIIN
jgi:hypothetical protein